MDSDRHLSHRFKDSLGMTNNFTYDDYCRMIGNLYLFNQAQEGESKALINTLNERVAVLEKENRILREQCNTLKENIS